MRIDFDRLDQRFIFIITGIGDENRTVEITEGRRRDIIEFRMVGQNIDVEAFGDDGGFDGALLRIRSREFRLRMNAVCTEETHIEVEAFEELKSEASDEGIRGDLQFSSRHITDEVSFRHLLRKKR